MNKRGQAAMEFLMTYGWAIVVVLAAIGALAYFGVLSPQKLLPARTVFPAPIPSVDNAVVSASGKSVSIAFRNNKGTTITLPGVTAAVPAADFVLGTGTIFCTAGTITLTGTYNGAAIATNTAIPNGAPFILTWTCSGTTDPAYTVGNKLDVDSLSFNYVNTDTTQTLSQTGSIQSTFGI